MKKLFSLLLVLMLALGCTAFAEGADYTGEWVLTGAEGNGTVLDISGMGLEMSMLLNEDGTCTLITNGMGETGAWVEIEGGVTVTDGAGAANDFMLTEDKLVAEEGGAKMIFSRVGEMGAYADVWVVTSMEMMGMTMDAASAGLEMSMELKVDGTGVLAANGATDVCTWAVTATGITTTDSAGTVDAYTLVDGRLVASVESDGLTISVVFTRESEVAAQTSAMPQFDLAVEDFNGDWNFIYAKTQGFTISSEMAGLIINISLKDGEGYAMLTDGQTVEEYRGVTEVEETEVGTAMCLLFVNEAGEQDGTGMILYLCDNGELVWYQEDESEIETYYYFEFVEAEEAAAE